MEKLQILVATMHRTDMSFIADMNIRCSAVIANQADREEITNKKTEYGTLKMITTATRGVGLNRNIALLAAESEIVLFADDDMVYRNDVPEKVLNAFRDNPSADVIIFGVDIVKGGEIVERRYLPNVRRRVWNSMKFGTYAIAARRKSLLRENIMFSQNFGGGCIYSSGEDSLFLKTCFERGLKVYSNEYVLGACCKDTSSWFRGFNEKYFYDKGVLLRYLFPKSSYLVALYFGGRFSGKTDFGLFKRLSLMYKGIREGKKMIPYGEENEKDRHSE